MEKLLTFIKRNFLNIIVVLLVSVILLQRCYKKDLIVEPTVVRDTIWIAAAGTITTLPGLVRTIPGKIVKEYLPDPNYNNLVLQYEDLVKKHIANNIYKDSIKVDSLGYVQITDTVSKNFLKGRKVSYNFKYPKINTTITLPPNYNNQLYYGGGVEVNPNASTTAINLGLLLKTKNENIYNVYGGVDTRGDYQIGLQSYWKISFKKKK